jgi:hypothetical protein
LSSNITTHEDLNNEVPVSENNSVDNDDSQSQDEQKCQPSNDICDTDTRFCCKNCGTDLFEDKQFLCSFSRKHFMNEVLSSDVICIRYTGVPNRSMLKGFFSG